MKDILQDIIANKRIEVERQNKLSGCRPYWGWAVNDSNILPVPCGRLSQHLHRASLLSLREKVLRKAGYIPMLL